MRNIFGSNAQTERRPDLPGLSGHGAGCHLGRQSNTHMEIGERCVTRLREKMIKFCIPRPGASVKNANDHLKHSTFVNQCRPMIFNKNKNIAT